MISEKSLLDIKLPGSSGLDILKIIHDENLPIQVIVISSWDDCYTMKQAMQLGAYEYIHKPQMTSTQLLEMILKIQAQLLHDNIRSNSRICKDKNSLIDFNIENWLSVKCANSFVLIYFTVHKNDKMENITTQKTVTSFIQEFISAKKEILLVSYMQNGCTLSVFSNDVSEHNFLKKISLLTNTLKNYVDKNYYSDISLIALSEKLHLTPSYISRLFKKEFGINLFEYITEIRIQSAKDLLKSTDFKIYEIAERIGFKSTINFDYAFKRITGISPSKYRDN